MPRGNFGSGGPLLLHAYGCTCFNMIADGAILFPYLIKPIKYEDSTEASQYKLVAEIYKKIPIYQRRKTTFILEQDPSVK